MNLKALAVGIALGALFAAIPSCAGGKTGGAGGGMGGSSGGGGRGGGAGGGGGSGTCCGATNGCCTPNGSTMLCIPATTSGQNQTTCGTGGEACHACGAGANCVAGVCTIPDGGVMSVTGTPCEDAGTCSSLGTNFTCKLKTTINDAPYPGGYCSKQACSNSTNPCASDAVCTQLGLVFGEPATAPMCLSKCSVSGCANGGFCTCRLSEGYSCYRLVANQDPGVCYLDSAHLPKDIDAGPASDKIGSPCTSAAQCANPPDPSLAGCFGPTLPDAGPSGFTGGYCTANCGSFGYICGDGGICLTAGGAFRCFVSCMNPGAGQDICRPDYVCVGLVTSDGGMAPGGACVPGCFAPGSACTSGYCDGGYCVP